MPGLIIILRVNEISILLFRELFLNSPIFLIKGMDRYVRIRKLRGNKNMKKYLFSSVMYVIIILAIVINLYSKPVDYERTENVIYGWKDGMALTMDVFKPEKQSGIGVLLMISGNWQSDHDEINKKWIEKIQKLVDYGQTVFAVVHSSAPKYKVPEIAKDIEGAVRYVRINSTRWGVDTNRLGITGESSGGHLSLLLASTASKKISESGDSIDSLSTMVNAVACFFPPVDFRFFSAPELDIMNNPKYRNLILAFIDNPGDETGLRSVASEVSPINYISNFMPPTLIISGDADVKVPVANSIEFNNSLEELGVPHHLVIRKGKGHGWDEMDEDYILIAEWFNKYL